MVIPKRDAAKVVITLRRDDGVALTRSLLSQANSQSTHHAERDGYHATVRILMCLVAVILMLPSDIVRAEVTPEQSKELRELKKEVAGITALLRKKQFDEAEQALDTAEEKVQAIIEAAGVEATSRRLLGLPKLIDSRRQALELQRQRAAGTPAKQQGVSFSNDVAPIFVEHCLECHGGANPRSGLNLSTFKGWKRGGVGGVLLVPGAPLKSLMIARLRAPNPMHRMPRGKDPLSVEQLNTIATWINEGARFDGASDETPLGELAKPKPKVEIPKPEGTETVSFTKDIAPFMVRLCVGCHSGANPRGGLSLTTFENMMIGGDSGAVILPGNREESRLFRLTGGLENPRMPASQARLTRKNYNNLVTWFNEGNVFDGDDPRALLTSYVPSEEEMTAERFTKMSLDEITTHRREQTDALWKQSLPNIEPHSFENDQFILKGDVPVERLQSVRAWADETVQLLQKVCADESSNDGATIWRGKLGILVFKERFGLTEYFLSVRSVQQSEGVFGDAVVTTSGEDAYIVLLDTGDMSTEASPSLQSSLRMQLASAYLSRNRDRTAEPGGVVFTQGLGMSIAAGQESASPYFRSLQSSAMERLRTIGSPAELFAIGTFSPADRGPVGYAMIRFFESQTSKAVVTNLMQSWCGSAGTEEALKAVAGSDLETFGASFLQAVKSSR